MFLFINAVSHAAAQKWQSFPPGGWVKDDLREKELDLQSGEVEAFIFTCVQASDGWYPTMNFWGNSIGGFDYMYVRHVYQLSIAYNYGKVDVPFSCYADLGSVRKAWIEIRGKKWVLVMKGGLPGDQYQCWITGKQQVVLSRFITYTKPSGQFAYEKTVYHYPNFTPN